tara:strand:+ start:8119 stop:8763 length:645 start_codon:yes stop_codon:yes gene_type:complete
MTKTLLPNNAQPAEIAIDRAGAARLEALPLGLAALWSVDECPEEFIPFLAYALSVDVWKTRWPLEIKRRVLRESWAVHASKGTRAGVERALGALDVSTVITEWFETGGAPYTFKVRALAGQSLDPDSEAIIGPDFEALVREIIDAVKPVRAHYDVEVGAKSAARLGVTAATQLADVRRFHADLGQAEIRPRAEAGLCAGTHVRQVVFISAEVAA